MECQEPFLLISESDLTRLFYYGNRDPFPCNWIQIGSLGIRSPNTPLDVIPSDTNASTAMKAYYSHGNNALMPSEGTGCTSELYPVIARQVPSLPRRLRGDNILHVKQLSCSSKWQSSLALSFQQTQEQPYQNRFETSTAGKYWRTLLLLACSSLTLLTKGNSPRGCARTKEKRFFRLSRNRIGQH